MSESDGLDLLKIHPVFPSLESNNEVLGFNASPFLNLSSTSTKPIFFQKGMASSKAWSTIPLEPVVTAHACTAWSSDMCSDD